MGQDITRRDFINGAALTVAAGLTPFEQLQAQALRRGFYPPALAGLRGSTDDAYAVIHGVAREGRRYDIDKVEAEDRALSQARPVQVRVLRPRNLRRRPARHGRSADARVRRVRAQ